MNIDIVNKQVSKDLKIDEKKVALVNKYYWSRVKEHIYSYNSKPVNIENVCVLYPAPWLVKKSILYYINLIRKIKKSKRFADNSLKREGYINNYKQYIRHFLKIRKENKFTN